MAAWVAPVVGAAISALGSLFGGRKSNESNAKMMKEQLRYQREFAQQGIQWRVEDAKKAGLHPLYALGAQTPSYSPVYSSDSMGPAIANASDSIGRAVSQIGADRATKAAERMAMLEAASRISSNEAMAQYYRSLAARSGHEAMHTVGMPEINSSNPIGFQASEPVLMEGASTSGGAILKMPEISTSRPGTDHVVGGPANPSLREYQLGGMKMLLPDASNLGEALEPLSESWPLAYGVYRENVEHYGEAWKEQFLRKYGPDWGAWIRGLFGAAGKIKRRSKTESMRGRPRRGSYVPYEGY